MSHFAKLDENNVVVFVTVGRQEDDGKEAVHALGGTPFRKNYAGIGYTYDAGRDAFIPPKPFASWVLNETTCLWDAPVPYPVDGDRYTWNESVGNWEKS